jgi:hypothetical protein
MSQLNLCDDDGVAIACTSASTATLIARDSYETLAEQVCIENRGYMPARLRCGGADVVAGDMCITLPPRSRELFAKRAGATHLAAVCDPGCATALVAWCIGGTR